MYCMASPLGFGASVGQAALKLSVAPIVPFVRLESHKVTVAVLVVADIVIDMVAATTAAPRAYLYGSVPTAAMFLGRRGLQRVSFIQENHKRESRFSDTVFLFTASHPSGALAPGPLTFGGVGGSLPRAPVAALPSFGSIHSSTLGAPARASAHVLAHAHVWSMGTRSRRTFHARLPGPIAVVIDGPSCGVGPAR